MRLGKLVSFYLIRAVLPYIALSWLVLTAILFVQQAGRYSDIFFNPNLPSSFIWQLSFALIPNVIAFTCPMAVLVGVMIGLSRMQVDNELIAIRNIGIGNISAIVPVLVLGVLFSFFSIAVNIFGVPLASRAVRAVALRSALYKLESPIEPGVFNTEVAGFTIYVRDADLENGRWKNVFVYNEDVETRKSRLITSQSGRIDSSGQNSELVLENAVVSTLEDSSSGGKLISENIGELRLAIKTKRDEMVGRLGTVTADVEELGLVELLQYAAVQQGREATEARILVVRRIVLSFAPILFCLLGAAMMLGSSRRGRGFGILTALASLLIYFLFTFAGEQLTRAGAVPVIIGGLVAPLVTLIVAGFFLFRGNRYLGFGITEKIGRILKGRVRQKRFHRQRDIFVDLTTGIRDIELIYSLLKFYFLSAAFVAAVFMIFTAFELWRHAGSYSGGAGDLLRYLAYLSPFTYLQLAPTAGMVAILAVFTIKSRQNEVVVWLASGQSVYRLLLPCFLLMLFLGGLNFAIQENVATTTNRYQETLRRLMRNRGNPPKPDDRQWVATDRSIASYKIITTASDNEPGRIPDCSTRCTLRDITVYQFEANKAELQSVYRVSEGVWDSGTLNVTGSGERFEIHPTGFVRQEISNTSIPLDRSTFSGVSLKTNQMQLSEIAARVEDADSDTERRTLALALQKRRSTLFLPFIIGLFTAPFALGMERKGRVVSIAYGVGLWLVLIAVISGFDQLGLVGTLQPWMAVWSPLIVFSMLGIYLLSRVRT